MNKWLNFSVQVLGFTSQVVIPIFVQNREKQIAFSGGIGAIQGIVGGICHFYNPDGTSAKVAYRPEK